MKKEIINYFFIIIGSVLYAIATVIFIFPHSLLLGGTSGISVILNEYISFSPGTILVIINFSLLVAAFVVLGKDMAIKTFVGSTLTTLFVGVFEKMFHNSTIFISNVYNRHLYLLLMKKSVTKPQSSIFHHCQKSTLSG